MNSPFLMFFSAEAGNFLHGHSFRDGGMKLELGSAFSRLWDEGAIEKKIASTKDVQGTIKLRNRRMSMLLLFQASVGGSLFRDAKLGGQGFLQRFLLVQVHNRLIPPDPDWSKEGRQKMKDIYKTFDGFHNRIGELLFKPEDVELKLPVLTLTDDATVECSDYRQNCNERIALDVDENRVSYIARLPEHALRLAGTLAVFRGHDVVDSGDMSVGIYLAEMFRQERYGLDVPHEVKGIDYVKEAERLIEAIKGKGLVEFEMKDINTGFGWFRSHQTSDRHKILEEAEEKELIEVKSQSVSTGGRSKTVYKLIS